MVNAVSSFLATFAVLVVSRLLWKWLTKTRHVSPDAIIHYEIAVVATSGLILALLVNVHYQEVLYNSVWIIGTLAFTMASIEIGKKQFQKDKPWRARKDDLSTSMVFMFMWVISICLIGMPVGSLYNMATLPLLKALMIVEGVCGLSGFAAMIISWIYNKIYEKIYKHMRVK